MYWHHKVFLILGSLILTSCAVTPQKTTIISDIPNALCQNEMAAIDTNFPTARANKCRILSDTNLVLTIDPENIPINHSPWYAFRVTPKKEGNLNITLKYSHSKHRYPPKISDDGVKWNLLKPSKIDVISETEIRMHISLEAKSIYVSAQEMFSVAAHNKWIEKTERRSFVTKSIIGKSVEGRPLYKLEARTNPKIKKPYVVFVGRQHPPEVTGALALIPFVETVLGDSKLAKNFRDKYNIIIIPDMNPDGVTHGNWRHNMNGIDLNRDWGPFTQPETQAVEKEFRRFKTGKDDVAFFLDFHSTARNLLYTQVDDEPTKPAYFTRDWLNAVGNRLDDDVYKFTREAKHNSGKPISKNYMYKTYGISAITYEVGDNTDRKSLAIAADVFAEEMMKTLLKQESEL